MRSIKRQSTLVGSYHHDRFRANLCSEDQSDVGLILLAQYGQICDVGTLTPIIAYVRIYANLTSLNRSIRENFNFHRID